MNCTTLQSVLNLCSNKELSIFHYLLPIPPICRYRGYMDLLHKDTNVLAQSKHPDFLATAGLRRVATPEPWGAPESWVVQDLSNIQYHLKAIFGQEMYKLEMHPETFTRMWKSPEMELLKKVNGAENWSITPETTTNLLGIVVGIYYIILNGELDQALVYGLDVDDKLIAIIKVGPPKPSN